MFYIVKVSDNLISVLDTSDGVVDDLTPKEVLKAEELGIEVVGVHHFRGSICFCPYTDDLIKLMSIKIGTPVMVKVAKGIGFKQTLYIGHKFENERDIFYFYDDSGVDGYFGLASDYVAENKGSVQFDFENKERVRASILTRRFKDFGGR